MLKALALLLVFVGAAGLITGLLGVFGPDVVSISPWILIILGVFFFLSGYGLSAKTWMSLNNDKTIRSGKYPIDSPSANRQ